MRGENEPLYVPRDDSGGYDFIYFANDFFSSALHEIAHWCVAGQRRRRLLDYGYWYRSDKRTPSEQSEFEQVEAIPQAIEWIFTVAAGREFHVSTDNLGLTAANSERARVQFQGKIAKQVQIFIKKGLPPRALRFAEVLASRYGTGESWRHLEFYPVTEIGANE